MGRNHQKKEEALLFSISFSLDLPAIASGLKENYRYDPTTRQNQNSGTLSDPFDLGFNFEIVESDDGLSPDNCAYRITAKRSPIEWYKISQTDIFRYSDALTRRYITILSEATGIDLFQHITEIQTDTPFTSKTDAMPTEGLRQIAQRVFPVKQIMRIVKAEKRSDITVLTLKKTDGFIAAPFRAGQFVTLSGYENVTDARFPFLLCSSTASAKEGLYSVYHLPDAEDDSVFCNSLREGNIIEVSAPQGKFFYNSIRDHSTVIGMTDVYGAGAFLSMGRTIRDYLDKFKLTVLYFGTENDEFPFAHEFDEICSSCSRVRFVTVKTEERQLFSAETFRRFLPHEAYSVFICGSYQFCRQINDILSPLNLPKKSLRALVCASG